MTDELVLRLLRRAEGWPAASPADWAGRLASRSVAHRSESFERLAARAMREAELFAGHAPLVLPARTPTATATWGADAATPQPDLGPPTVTPTASTPSNSLLLGSPVAPVAAGSAVPVASASASAAESDAAPPAPDEAETPVPPGEGEAAIARGEIEAPAPAFVEPAAGLPTVRPPVVPAARLERAAPSPGGAATPTVQRRAEPAPTAPTSLSAASATPSLSPPLRIVPAAGRRAAADPAASELGARWEPVVAPRAVRSPEEPEPMPGRPFTAVPERLSAAVERPLVVVASAPPARTGEVDLTPLAPSVAEPSTTSERDATSAPAELVLAAAPPTITRTEFAAALESLGRPADPPSLSAAAAESPSRPPAEPAVDVDGLADRVYGLLVRRLAAERERRGL